MRVADIDVHPVARRPAQTRGKEVAVVIRDARRAELRTADRRLIVSEPGAQRELLARIPFEADRVTQRVFVVDVQYLAGCAGIREDNRHILQAAPACPGDVTQNGELPREPL